VKNEEYEDALKKIWRCKIETLLDEDLYQTETDLIALNVIQQCISQRLYAMGMIQKQGNCYVTILNYMHAVLTTSIRKREFIYTPNNYVYTHTYNFVYIYIHTK